VSTAGDLSLQGTKEMPLNLVQQMVNVALDELYWNAGRDFWPQAFFDDNVVAFSAQEGLMKFPFKVTKEGKLELGDPEPVSVEYVPLNKQKFFLKTTKSGVRWMAVSSDVLPDLTEETISEKALRYAIDFAAKNKALGELRMEHHPASRVGYCDSQMFYNGKLIETGFFDDTERAQNCVKTLMADADGKYKISIGFLYDDQKFINKTYEDEVIIFERSITDHPANVRTAIGVTMLGLTEGEVKSMTDPITYQKLVELVGETEAKKIVDSGAAGLKNVMNVKFKSDEGENVEVEGQKTQEVGKAPESATPESPVGEGQDPERIVEEMEFDFQGKTYKAYLKESDPVPALNAKVTELTSKVAELEAKKADAPFLPRVVTYRATKTEKVAEPSAPTPEAVVAAKAAEAEDFWGAFPGGQKVPVPIKSAEVAD
jgi:predicted  nucleic acid-binding Zn-ribbon protein